MTVRTLAERMISISDNTATDHLLYTVGRVRVEAAMRATKPSKPTANVPFLSTREMFALKLGPAEQLATYLALPGKKRRHFLDTDVARKRPTIEQVTGWDAPRHIDDLEWFATPRDLCSVMATLDARAHKAVAAPLRDVLAINNGLALDAKTWPYAGYKGGSEPGVMNLTWLLGRDDGKRFVVSLTVNSVAPPVFAESAVLGFATGVLEALALEQR